MKLVSIRGDRTKRKEQKRHIFVNTLIVLCLTMCIIITVGTMLEYHRLDLPLGAAELGVLCSIWGGELLLIVVRQVLGADVTHNHKGG